MIWIALAHAQVPLAIPAQPDPTTQAPRAATLSMANLGEYRRRAVSVRRYSTLHGGGARAVGWGYGWPGFGSPYVGWSVTHVIQDPVIEVEHWAVFQDNRRLTVPEWMDVAGVPEARDAHRKRVRRTRNWHRGFIGAAVIGAVGFIGASYASQTAATYDEFEDLQLAGSVGATTLIGGIIGAYGTGIHARTLRYDFDATQSLAETHDWAESYNASLRDELGLSPMDTAPVDGGR